MENRSGSGARAGSLGGKGFYIVLFLCAAVIGVSAWIMLTDAGTNVEATQTMDTIPVNVSEAVVTMIPAYQPELPEIVDAAEQDDNTIQTMEGDGADAQEAMADGAVEDADQTQAVFSETVTSYVWPVQGSIQVPYSITTLMYDSTMADWRTHDGIDIAAAQGTQVLAAAGGMVAAVGTSDLYGTVVEIDHGNGVHSVYANLAGSPNVTAGEVVTMGQVIGSVGATALAETNQVSHLHFAMTQDGVSADPTLYLPSGVLD